MKQFPEIRPEDASPEIAEIYAEILAVSGVPVVNLIWRHFAALPGVLAWAWPAVRPLVGSREMAAARTRIARAVVLPVFVPPSKAEWQKAGVDAAALPGVAATIDAYVRGNTTNIVALTALRLRLDEPDAPPVSLTPAEPPAPAAALPALPRIDTLDPVLAARIRTLAACHDGAGDGVIPSLYLALAPWPGVIAALPDWLGPLLAADALRAARESVVRTAATEAAALMPTLGPAPAGLDAMRPALERFTRLVIPDLIPVCVAFRDLLAGA